MRSRELLLSLLERAVNLVPFRDEYIQPGRAATLDPAAYENIYTHTHTKQLYTCVYTCVIHISSLRLTTHASSCLFCISDAKRVLDAVQIYTTKHACIHTCTCTGGRADGRTYLDLAMT